MRIVYQLLNKSVVIQVRALIYSNYYMYIIILEFGIIGKPTYFSIAMTLVCK